MVKKAMTKDEFINNYLAKSRRLKYHKLPYGMAYLNLFAKVQEDAEKKFNKQFKNE